MQRAQNNQCFVHFNQNNQCSVQFSTHASIKKWSLKMMLILSVIPSVLCMCGANSMTSSYLLFPIHLSFPFGTTSFPNVVLLSNAIHSSNVTNKFLSLFINQYFSNNWQVSLAAVLIWLFFLSMMSSIFFCITVFWIYQLFLLLFIVQTFCIHDIY